MSLSHTHHHLSPGCPIGRPQRVRAEEREQGGQPQHKQKVAEMRTEGAAHRSVLLKTMSGQQGEPKYQNTKMISEGKLGHIISPQNEQQWLWEQWLSHFCIRKGQKTRMTAKSLREVPTLGNTPVVSLLAWRVTYTDCMKARMCLWAYLRSESLPSCSPSLFL